MRWLTHFDDSFVQAALSSCVRKCCAWRIPPNAVTIISLTISAAIPFLHFRRLTWWVVASMVLRQVLDALDGEIARRCGKVTKLGGLLDSIADSVFLYVLTVIIVSCFKLSVAMVFLFSSLIFGGFLAAHLSICKGSAMLDHTVKTYDTPSLYRRAFAYMANNGLILVTLFAVIYRLVS
jgi:phosphatidylglycerophosphate synthase